MAGWLPAAAFNVVVALAYLSIGWHILNGVRRTGSWRTNPLALATGLIFLSCSAGHAGHVGHLVDPATRAASLQVYDLHLVVVDGVTAVIALWYWSLRGRFPALVRGAAVFEDLEARREEALDLHDHVVQQLATAKLAFELGEHDQGLRALDAGLESSRRIVTDLVGDHHASDATMRPGGLRRSAATPP
jgi:signal transduction histidine kinase